MFPGVKNAVCYETLKLEKMAQMCLIDMNTMHKNHCNITSIAINTFSPNIPKMCMC